MEKPPSIVCDICSGWHPTKGHPEYEKEAREKRLAEIKARSDSAYSFDTLGFKSERREEIEPWMHKVIEKARELGDDLQDSDFFLHVSSMTKGKSEFSPMSFLEQASFQEDPLQHSSFDRSGGFQKPGKTVWTVIHPAGESLTETKEQKLAYGAEGTMGWAGINKQHTKLFEKQERWLKTRSIDDLTEYKRAIIELLGDQELPTELRETKKGLKRSLSSLKEELSELEDRILLESKMSKHTMIARLGYLPDHKRKKGELLKTIDQITYEINKIDKLETKLYEKIDKFEDVEERRKAVLSIQKRGMGGSPIGVIFHSNQFILEKFPKREIGNDVETYTTQNGLAIVTIGGKDETTITPDNELTDLESAREFYQQFLHGIMVIYGSVEEQRQVLEKMLETTKDNPERRLPLYNFYGKLVWPKPKKN